MKDKKNSDIAKKNLALDEDRMINEGLGGGTVSPRENSGIIENSRNLEVEGAPRRTQP
ncbi:hypothetical protein [Salipaludibacillus neizhouensis]|uniref:hypothetical protein n=1 Tax=Salipaludibacillus neizhouensis TaxID=885475 RepID=UPI0016028590|nr:hypothetical protein [Salipaludibacillus neizhouensis]